VRGTADAPAAVTMINTPGSTLDSPTPVSNEQLAEVTGGGGFGDWASLAGNVISMVAKQKKSSAASKPSATSSGSSSGTGFLSMFNNLGTLGKKPSASSEPKVSNASDSTPSSDSESA
jgi:hypothetical protein